MRRGLVVGKFMPLHRGHQLLIETALSQVDDLTIVIYDSDPPGEYAPMPIHTRMKWMTALYPQAENIVARHDILTNVSQEEKDDPKYAQAYADDLDFLGPFDYVFSSEDYGKPFADALGATSVVVDQARLLVPISGTTIREDTYKHRGYVDPLVYRDLIQKVVFVGTESAGKTTIARRMAKEFNTLWAHEYGRELWESQGLTGTFRDMLKIATKQYAREEASVRNSNRYLFCDTNPWTTLQWSLMYSGTADARLYELAEKTMQEYKWIFCKADFGWVNDGVRELVNGKAGLFEAQQTLDLRNRGIVFETIVGTVEERVAQVRRFLGTL
jgi:HTH-type transcriptional repressor of NAD biosynthesis genes